ncbi:MAG: AAA family ATPase [Gammaproteobacteria bacterium]|nr:AAA family ATPase [Gammaproteobacteria bacterium]
MQKRLLSLSTHYSLFLFGARGVGKSTLVERVYKIQTTESSYINLLDTVIEDRFARNPMELVAIVEAMPSSVHYVIIDEIQKVPKLLDVVHLLLETKKCGKYFILTGSSARKLKVAGVNLLAGRAFVYHLYPFSYLELGDSFDLQSALLYGMLPGVFNFKNTQEKQQFLQAYTLTYLKEEIWAEHLIKQLDPFRRFLEVAAQSNGKIINYSNISRDVGADDKTVKNYFSLLEDTLLGVLLEPYHHSFRKRLHAAPKFYFFDIGVTRALARMLGVIPVPGTSYYGEIFESFIVMECIKLAAYFQTEYRFSYLMTGAGVEVDLVVERPGKPVLLIEIKSTQEVRDSDLRALQQLAKDIGPSELVCFSNDPYKKKVDQVMVYPWQEGVKYYFGDSSRHDF